MAGGQDKPKTKHLSTVDDQIFGPAQSFEQPLLYWNDVHWRLNLLMPPGVSLFSRRDLCARYKKKLQPWRKSALLRLLLARWEVCHSWSDSSGPRECARMRAAQFKRACLQSPLVLDETACKGADSWTTLPKLPTLCSWDGTYSITTACAHTRPHGGPT